jgi:anhydro-N-acetylmuramic acid kinase
MNQAVILGIMSGTSLDGVDLAMCRLSRNPDKYEILKAETVPYSQEWTAKLKTAETCSGLELINLHREYGKFLGTLAKSFAGNISVDAIASHGHTIFHNPSKGLTFQIGCGAELAVASGITTIADFRITDVAHGGQGAPLVPAGDATLFSEYEYCLNLGGFINVSYDESGIRLAFDIAPMNYVLNRIAQREGKTFDDRGMLANAGKCIDSLLRKLNNLQYYSALPPKSLGREWVEKEIFPLLTEETAAVDLLHTFAIHAAEQTARVLNKSGKVLVTGGGTYNTFFIEELRKRSKAEIVIPDDQLAGFKEALIFAWLGFLRLRGENNALSSVTGAHRDSCGGAIFSA